VEEAVNFWRREKS